MYKKTLFPDDKRDAKLVGEFNRINNRDMKINTVKQEKEMLTALDNKRMCVKMVFILWLGVMNRFL